MSEKVFNIPEVFPPGDTLKEWITEKGMSQVELATRLGKLPKDVSKLLSGELSVTQDWAERLQVVTGISSKFWRAKQDSYDAYRKKEEAKTNEQRIWENWISYFPLNLMKKNGWIDSQLKKRSDIITAVSVFFGTINQDAWENTYKLKIQGSSFRKSQRFNSDLYSTAAWIRQGERMADKLLNENPNTPPYDKKRLKSLMPEIKALLATPENVAINLQKLLLSAGVYLVFVKSFSGISANGVSMLYGRKPVIILSGRGKRYDMFAFTLLHEIAHILLHINTQKSLFIDEDTTSRDGNKEIEADRFAEKAFFSNEFLHQINTDLSIKGICATANNEGVHPSLVVGNLQHRGVIPYAKGNVDYKELLINVSLPY